MGSTSQSSDMSSSSRVPSGAVGGKTIEKGGRRIEKEEGVIPSLPWPIAIIFMHGPFLEKL